MRSYPKNNLSKYFYSHGSFRWFSPRLPDFTNKWTVDYMNFAINICEKWNTFLDIGAGDGRYSRTLAPKFKKGYAVESTSNDNFASIHSDFPNVTCVTKYIQHTSIKEKIDFVLLADVFEHIPLKDIQSFVKKINSMQSTGGVVYILTPNAIRCAPAFLSGIYHTRLPDGHYKHYLKQEIDEQFEKYGYIPVLARYEDANLRLIVKSSLMLVSNLDKRMARSAFTRAITSPFILIVGLFFKILTVLVTIDEGLHVNDVFNTQTLVVVYKKIKK